MQFSIFHLLQLITLIFLAKVNCNNEFEGTAKHFKEVLSKIEPYKDTVELFSKGTTCELYKEIFEEKEKYGKIRTNLIWIIQMFDASAKPTHSLLQGNAINYGGFDQCLNIKVETDSGTVKGKHCPFALNLGVPLKDNLAVRMNLSLCIPDSCDLLKVNEFCQTLDEYDLTEKDWAFLGVIMFIVIIMIISTIYDIYIYCTEKKVKNPLFIAFSVFTNGRKLFAISKGQSQISCLNGLRFFSMIWIVAGHAYAISQLVPFDNPLEAIDWQLSLKGFFLPGARVSVDTFFYLSALLLSYNSLKSIDKSLTLGKLPLFYIHRLLRIMPAYAAMFFYQQTVANKLITTPLQKVMTTNYCSEYWWSYFLFIQNYVNWETMCFIPAWYLAADMQLFILSPLLLIPLTKLRKNKKLRYSYILCTFVTVSSILIPMIVDFFRDNKNIYETHARLSTYLIGILMGMILIDYREKKLHISKLINLLLWTVSLGVMLTIILCLHDLEYHPEKVKTNIFFTFSRPAWALSLSWLVFACVKGLGGPINWLLSKDSFQIMTRLTFSMYLLHNVVLGLIMSSFRTTQHFSVFFLTCITCAAHILTVLISIATVLVFESPVVVLEKFFFG